MARRKHRKKNKMIPFLAVAVLVILAVATVSIAFFLREPDDDGTPTDGPVTTTQTTSDLFATDPVTDVFSSATSSATTSDLTTDTEELTDTVSSSRVTSSKSSSSDKNQTTTNTDEPLDTPKDSLSLQVSKPADGVKRIAFTFDDGPYYEYTTSIADMFVQYGGKCTYFIVGNRVTGKNQEAMIYAANKGHEIAIHGYTHNAYYNKCSNETYLKEINQTHDAIVNSIGVAPTLMRPPGGSITNKRVENSPYSVILWNVDPKDWYYKKESKANVNQIVNHILKYAEDGDIVLMHDLYKNTRDAVEILLPKLKEQGFEFVTVSELMGEAKEAGHRYSGGYN